MFSNIDLSQPDGDRWFLGVELKSHADIPRDAGVEVLKGLHQAIESLDAMFPGLSEQVKWNDIVDGSYDKAASYALSDVPEAVLNEAAFAEHDRRWVAAQVDCPRCKKPMLYSGSLMRTCALCGLFANSTMRDGEHIIYEWQENGETGEWVPPVEETS